MTRSVGKGRDEVPDRQGGRESPQHLGPARAVLYQDSVNSSSGYGCVHRLLSSGGGILCNPACGVTDFDQ